MKEGIPSSSGVEAKEQTGGIHETYREPIENTPEEDYVIGRYVELSMKAIETEGTLEEAVQTEEELRELYRYLSNQPNIEDAVRADMKEQVKRLVSNLISIKNINAKFKELEASTQEGSNIPWRMRDEIVRSIADAHKRYGLADAAYDAFVRRLGDWQESSGVADILYHENNA